MRASFKEIRVGLNDQRGWLVFFSGRVVAVLVQLGDADPEATLCVVAAMIEPYCSFWGTAWSSLDLAKADFHEVCRLYATGATPEEVRAWGMQRN